MAHADSKVTTVCCCKLSTTIANEVEQLTIKCNNDAEVGFK